MWDARLAAPVVRETIARRQAPGGCAESHERVEEAHLEEAGVLRVDLFWR